MSRHTRKKSYVAAIIEGVNNHILVVTTGDASVSDRAWLFPRGPVRPGESPESALRRVVRDDLGLDLEIVVGQPPLVGPVDGEQVELRYFFCGVSLGEATPDPYSDVRWIPRAHLREYEFDEASRGVVEWILEEDRA